MLFCFVLFGFSKILEDDISKTRQDNSVIYGMFQEQQLYILPLGIKLHILMPNKHAAAHPLHKEISGMRSCPLQHRFVCMGLWMLNNSHCRHCDKSTKKFGFGAEGCILNSLSIGSGTLTSIATQVVRYGTTRLNRNSTRRHCDTQEGRSWRRMWWSASWEIQPCRKTRLEINFIQKNNNNKVVFCKDFTGKKFS